MTPAPRIDGAPLTWRSLLALGIAGGLVPCPSALVLMLGAIALQIALGLALLVAFSLGLASTLTTIGLIVVYSGRAVGRFRLAERLGSGAGSRLRFVARALPIAGAGLVSVAGLALAVEASLQLGLPHLLAGAP